MKLLGLVLVYAPADELVLATLFAVILAGAIIAAAQIAVDEWRLR